MAENTAQMETNSDLNPVLPLSPSDTWQPLMKALLSIAGKVQRGGK
jgi:hypothetical protein